MTAKPDMPLVLLVDASPVVHRLLMSRLRHERYQFIACTTGKRALEVMHQRSVSAVLLDLELGEMDGYEVLRAIRENGATRNVPVIILSAENTPEAKVAAFDLGAMDYVTKPCDLTELRARLRAALRLDRLLRLLAERAEVDGLTGLGNRAQFDRAWAERVGECERYPLALSLALLDADHFKRINDTYGHPAGDEVLQGISHLLQRECRQADAVCRYGGEEFAMIMPSTAPAEAVAVAERIRAGVKRIRWPRHPETPVTLSVGIVGVGPDDPRLSAEKWLELADRNLYLAKERGRNCVVSTDTRGAFTSSAPALATSA